MAPSSRSSASAFVRAVDVDLGLDDRHEAVRENLLADLELLVDDRRHACVVGQLDDRAFLGAEDAVGRRHARAARRDRGSAS